jgi:hypothetical protein
MIWEREAQSLIYVVMRNIYNLIHTIINQYLAGPPIAHIHLKNPHALLGP